MFLDFLKGLWEIKKSSKKQKEIFENIKKGDIVWAKMPLSQKELETIEKNHRIRPYLVMHKDRAYFYAYKSTHVYPYLLNNYNMYFIDKSKYKQKKDSYFMLDKLEKIPISNLMNRGYSLNYVDRQNIQKRLEIQKNRHNKTLYDFDVGFNVSIGDVLYMNNTLNYVYSTNKNDFFCYKMSTKLDKLNEMQNVNINDKDYYIFFNEKKRV